MNKIIILCFFFSIILCEKIPNNITIISKLPKCKTNDECLRNHICKNGFCKHKGFLPPNLSQIIEIILMCLLSTVSTAAGVGGGAIYSALLMFIENFDAQIAFPISSFSIFICSCITFYLGVIDKINDPKMKFIDYDLAIIFCPSLLLGTKIGVILNGIFPALILICFLIVSLSFSCYKTYKNALKIQKREKDLLKLEKSEDLKRSFLLDFDNISTINERESIDIIDLNNSINNHKSLERKFSKSYLEEVYTTTDLFNSVNSPIRIERLKWILLLELCMLLDQLLEGSKKLASIINIEKCSKYFWGIFILFISFCLGFTKIFYSKIKDEAKIEPSPLLVESPNEFNITSPKVEQKVYKIVFYCFLAGVISGMLGIGGGILMAPLMLELGVNTSVATATSNFFLIFTSFSNSCLYMMAGNLVLSYALMFGFFCGISSYFGNNILINYVHKTKKQSPLIWTLLFITILSLVILPINAIQHALYDLKIGKSILMFNNFCE